MESITFPPTLKKLGDQAFRNCSSLQVISLPESIEEMDGNAFQECSSLLMLKIPYTTNIKEHLFFPHCESLEYINIPPSVTEIHDGAFSFCRSLKCVHIHNRITRIGRDAFQFCESLCCFTYKQLELTEQFVNEEEYRILKYFFTPKNLNEIGEGAFRGCDKLRNIVFTTSHVSVGKHAFGGLKDGSEINIYTPYGTIKKFKDALILDRCNLHEYSSIQQIIENYEYTTSVNTLDLLFSEKRQDGSLVSLDGTRLLQVPENCINFIIPNGVKIICDFAFHRREKLERVIIPETVLKIGRYAFDHCHKLSMIDLPDSVLSIGDRAFSCCYALKSIIIPNGISIIPNRAFYYCKNLQTINIDSNIARIETRAFYGCSKLAITFTSRGETEAIELLKKVDEPCIIERLKFE